MQNTRIRTTLEVQVEPYIANTEPPLLLVLLLIMMMTMMMRCLFLLHRLLYRLHTTTFLPKCPTSVQIHVWYVFVYGAINTMMYIVQVKVLTSPLLIPPCRSISLSLSLSLCYDTIFWVTIDLVFVYHFSVIRAYTIVNTTSLHRQAHCIWVWCARLIRSHMRHTIKCDYHNVKCSRICINYVRLIPEPHIENPLYKTASQTYPSKLLYLHSLVSRRRHRQHTPCHIEMML